MSATRRSAEPDSPLRGDDPVRRGALDDYIAFHLQLAQNASFKSFKRHAAQADLRPGHFAVLSLINDNPGVTPLALSRAAGRDKSTLTPVLRDLDRAMLIRRCPSTADRRSHGLHLTDKGSEKLAHLAECAARHDRELDAIVGVGKPALLDMLRRLIAALD